MFAVGFPVRFVLIDLASDEVAFVMLRISLVDLDRLPFPLIGPQLFRFAAGILVDDIVRGIQNIRGRTVILLEEDDRRFWIVLLEVQNIRNVGAAPTVNRLVTVSHDANMMMLVRQHAAQHVLRPVRILVLVDMDIFEFVLIKIEHLRLFLEQLDRRHNKIVEIKRVIALEPLLVLRIDLRYDALEVVADVLLKPLRREQLVLRAADGRLDGAGLEFFSIKIQVLHAAPDDRELVSRVQDGEVRREADALDVPAQDAHAHGVERRHPDVAAFRANELRDPLLHLAGRLVRERNREDGPRRSLALRDEISDPMR